MNLFTRYRRTCALACLCLAFGALRTPAHAQDVSLTLAWDANSEPETSGYLVYIGSSPGAYNETQDVGPRTTFSYVPGLVGQRYYFAVAAYDADGRLSPLSGEISAVAGTPPVAGVAPSTSEQNALGTSHGVQAIVDGRGAGLLVIRDGRSIWSLASDLAFDEEILPEQPHVELTGIALDPSFDNTRHVYVGEVHGVRALRELRIVRYRLVGGFLGERAVVISGLTLADAHNAPFAVDPRGHIYIAMPGGSSGPSDLYAAKILRFNAVGSVPRTNPAGSPVFAEGFATPTALVVDANGLRLWMSGSGASWRGSIASLALTADTNATGVSPSALPTPFLGPGLVTALSIAGSRRAGGPVEIWLTEGSTFGRLDVDDATLLVHSFTPFAAGGVPTAVAIKGSFAYIAVAELTAVRAFALTESR